MWSQTYINIGHNLKKVINKDFKIINKICVKEVTKSRRFDLWFFFIFMNARKTRPFFFLFCTNDFILSLRKNIKNL
jgi:hypothetical protein